MQSLEKLGERICIIGLSSSGKSTLAQKLGERLQLNVLHLDQIAHLPNTNWVPREQTLMKKDHQKFLDENTKWVIEGNYSFLIPERFENATSIIWLDFSPIGALFRYIKRSILHRGKRPGNLEGATSQFSIKMIKYILFEAPKKHTKYQNYIRQSNARFIHLTSFKQLRYLMKLWKL